MNILKRTLAGLLIVFLAFGQVTSIPGTVDAVMGFSNLTTVGAIPYVSAAGTLSQDSGQLSWDATHNTLAIGGTPHAATAGRFKLYDSGGTNSLTQFLDGTYIYSVASQGGVSSGSVFSSTFAGIYANTAASTPQLRVLSTGSVGIGPNNSSPVGTLHVYDATATTGSTLVTVARGASQTASSTVLTMSGVPQFAGTNTTGAGSALLGTNSPAVTNTAPYTWIRVVTSDGSTAYIPAWK